MDDFFEILTGDFKEEEIGSVQIISKNEKTGKFNFDKSAFKQVLEKNNALYYPIVVISVAGPFRTGKSFLLNLFVRYFSTHIKSTWFEGRDKKGLLKLSGFGFRNGRQRETTGIHICDKVFVTPNDFEGKKVAVVLMDTQGMFDSETSDTENATIFSLSLLLSSMQVYNLKSQIQADALKHLHLFSSYAGYASENYNVKAFQSLYILIRDYEHDDLIGLEGGNKYLNEWLNSDSPDFVKLKDAFEKCFSDIKCCLLPHPGKIITKSSLGKKLIQISEIDEQFQTHVKNFVLSIARRGKLIVKTVNNYQYRSIDFIQLVENYVKVYNGDEFPSIKSQAEALDRSIIKIKVDKLKNLYFLKITDVCRNKIGSVEDLVSEFSKTVDELVSSLKYKSKEEKYKVTQMLRTELSENLQSLEKRLSDQLKTKLTISKMLSENFSVKKDKHLNDYKAHMKNYCKQHVDTLNKLVEIHLNYKLSFKKTFKSDCEKESFQTYEFTFNIKPVNKNVEIDNFQLKFLEESDDYFRLLEKKLENEKSNYEKEIARQVVFYEKTKSLIENKNEEMITKSKKEISNEDNLNNVINAVNKLTNKRLEEKLGCTTENYYFFFPVKNEIDSIREKSINSIKLLSKDKIENLRTNFNRELETRKDLRIKALEEYNSTCQSLKTKVYDAKLKNFIENHKVGFFKRVYRKVDFFGSIDYQIDTNKKLIESKANELKAECLNKYGEETSVDYCGDDNFEFATKKVLVEERKQSRTEVKTAFGRDCEKSKVGELNSFIQQQESCTIQ